MTILNQCSGRTKVYYFDACKYYVYQTKIITKTGNFDGNGGERLSL